MTHKKILTPLKSNSKINLTFNYRNSTILQDPMILDQDIILRFVAY